MSVCGVFLSLQSVHLVQRRLLSLLHWYELQPHGREGEAAGSGGGAGAAAGSEGKTPPLFLFSLTKSPQREGEVRLGAVAAETPAAASPFCSLALLFLSFFSPFSLRFQRLSAASSAPNLNAPLRFCPIYVS